MGSNLRIVVIPSLSVLVVWLFGYDGKGYRRNVMDAHASSLFLNRNANKNTDALRFMGTVGMGMREF